ncbi:DUF503 domain-containing protein [Gordonia paraffinivorans]|uniref:YlxP-like protein n=2 Tax=Gordonia paraffinivorans TaxID=175628 RepID=A0ABQ0IL74_9ACTN|nr:DUF503 domain-containing protein [Gordonia paraffinivorans]MBY4574587.1 hypothetical protein [Gordonia paraffinivorans]MCD2144702.1 DUF503 domain-containing protein [Gordonia paraffinivorans]PWD41696.1 hypothetical protein ACN93_17555 [Gordonia paraffinivorans]VFA81455.1 Protein of uncharacterised function (DUF503) [Gordonia paraffinivorans]GAC84302.1 hypothetical protein GP2_021_00200 [Gordonia paraffinivorans NBRC 108238]
MWIGFCEFDYRLGDVHSLKQKRSVVRPIVADIRRRHQVSVAEVGHLDVHRRASIGVSVVAADRGHVVDLLDAIERTAADHPEVELLSARRRIISADDL